MEAEGNSDAGNGGSGSRGRRFRAPPAAPGAPSAAPARATALLRGPNPAPRTGPDPAIGSARSCPPMAACASRDVTAARRRTEVAVPAGALRERVPGDSPGCSWASAHPAGPPGPLCRQSKGCGTGGTQKWAGSPRVKETEPRELGDPGRVQA